LRGRVYRPNGVSDAATAFEVKPLFGDGCLGDAAGAKRDELAGSVEAD
jgi:hypothetical protein